MTRHTHTLVAGDNPLGPSCGPQLFCAKYLLIREELAITYDNAIYGRSRVYGYTTNYPLGSFVSEGLRAGVVEYGVTHSLLLGADIMITDNDLSPTNTATKKGDCQVS